MGLGLKIHIFLLLFVLTLAQTSSCLGQDKENVKFCRICGVGIHKHEPPYSLTLKKELPFLISGTTLSVAALILQNFINLKPLSETQIANLDTDNIFFLDKSAANNNSKAAKKASDIIRNSITLLPLYFLSNHHNRKDFIRLFVLAGEVFTATYGITFITKNLVQRTRPFAYNDGIPLQSKGGVKIRRSFFSGHTSHTAALSFFVAKVMNDYHPHANAGFKIALWSFASILPATTAFLRVRAGKHFRTDVITGYLVGAGIGFIIPHLHKDKKNKESNLAVLPVFFGSTPGINLSYRFR